MENEIIEKTNNDRCYTVYMHTSPSGKRYIGITKRKPEKRWENGNGYKGNPYFWNAICRYGWENIKHEILYTNLDEEGAKQKEIELIAHYKSDVREFGYNIDHGGRCVGTMSEETKKILSTLKKELFANPENNPMYGKFHTEETKEKISVLTKKRFNDKKNHPLYGKHPSEETKQKIREANTGKHHSDETKQKISNAVKGEKHPMYGKHFSDEVRQRMREKHADFSGEKHPLYGKHHSDETKQKIRDGNKGKFVSEETRRKVSEANKGKHSREVLQFTMEMEFVAKYSSLLEAHNVTRINYSNISSCCRKRLKHAGYYIWRYVDDEYNEFRQAI